MSEIHFCGQNSIWGSYRDWLLSPLQVHFTEIRVREIEKKKHGMMYNVFNAELLFKI